ncbi:MAG TPA: hypothetical protein P5117_05640 [Spirochaetia bacterium]|nr:hypothetical protein [Spirochaetia bacterium]HRZ88949.1 hypothetical protein [Spirochaetia bacterium]
MSDEIDPEIAALLGTDTGPKGPAERKSAADTPDFDSLFGGAGVVMEERNKAEFDVDLTRARIAPVTKDQESVPNDFFSDPDFYRKALAAEGEESQKLHALLSKYLQTKDPKDRGVYRQQLIPAYWNLLHRVALKCASPGFPIAKQVLLRYGVLLPTLLSPEQQDMIQRVVHKKELDEPFYYMDEWLRAVALGHVGQSATDEVKSRSGDDRARFNAILQKVQGKKETAESLMKAKAETRRTLEGLLREKLDLLAQHDSVPGFYHVPAPYTEAQKKVMSEFQEVFRAMLQADKELGSSIEAFKDATAELESVRQKMDGLEEDVKANFQALAQEFETARQMTKLCVGRQGNHFPVLTREYFHGGSRDVGSRENVARLLAWIEGIDTQAFCRPYKNTLNRIVPYVVILPTYGDFGICWEPFDKFNRATSRGRLAVPLYPKSLQLAVVTAVADLRWQVAKEKASYYWMEEGLTGNYYQWFTSKKMKGDVKEFFIQDYILWITKESEGTQKLDKEVRGVFWRYMPFAQEIKDKLKTRSYVYQELYQKDINRSMSDGY